MRCHHLFIHLLNPHLLLEGKNLVLKYKSGTDAVSAFEIYYTSQPKCRLINGRLNVLISHSHSHCYSNDYSHYYLTSSHGNY